MHCSRHYQVVTINCVTVYFYTHIIIHSVQLTTNAHTSQHNSINMQTVYTADRLTAWELWQQNDFSPIYYK